MMKLDCCGKGWMDMTESAGKPFEALRAVCREILVGGGPARPLAIAERLMDEPGVAMHCPDHHFIVPAALLTAARMAQGAGPEQLEKDLSLAAERAAKVPGGMCGFQGCCGAAIGCGIYASVLLGANPKKQQGWATANRFTAACLAHVASVEGPRCCKRVTYLALERACALSGELLGVALPAEKAVCSRFALNRECRGEACPFYPA